ncbi:hypothetical protein AVEN_65815-1 [Araneus ventricosus]|uniref:Secreted protein n=1 Tax=Araneus ventricosus TaxID=182803 RepID=A0A4Y2WPY3_ARAVE|nr:hypothetical protein AVEN_51879-1 [Araneus ventricosus]GBO38018.1 hypothetical protein AVEN_65815-1 [Araneus ventricosus]
MSKLSVIIIQALLIKFADGIVNISKAGNSSVLHSTHLSQHLFFPHPFKSKARHSSEAPKCAGTRGERSSLPLYNCSSIPLQRISNKSSLIARSQSGQIV